MSGKRWECSKMAEEPSWVEALRHDLDGLPPDYAHARKRLQSYREMFHQELAKAFAPIVSREVREHPQSSYDEKRKLASWINRETRELGLSPICPKTHLPATIGAGVRDNEETSHRFYFITKSRGKRHSAIVQNINDLTICPDPVRKEGPAQLFDRNEKRGWGRS